MPPVILHSNPEHIDSMVVGQGHTILVGNLPEPIDAQEFNEKFYEWHKPTQESIQQLGLFGGNINYHTYYPELKEEDLKPKEEEFIEPVFRLLSATIVSKNWMPTDFGQGDVLKRSIKLMLGQTVNCDHETDIGNAIGAVSKVMWQEAYKDGNIYVPAGMNGVLKIDGKANPRIARGILMEPPSIHSNSVTVQFAWDKSHPEMDDNEFWDKIGTYDSKGNMVRRIVTNIVRYLETSLVSHGADSYAQKIGADGKIINPGFANRTWNSYSEYQKESPKVYAFQDSKELGKQDENLDDTLHLDNKDPKNSEPKNNSKMNQELKEFLEKFFGENMLQLGEGQEASVELALQLVGTAVKDLASLKDQLTTKDNEITSLQAEVAKKDTEIANLNEMATVGKNHIASLRESTVATYKKLAGEHVDETIVTMINTETTGLQTLLSLKKDYEARLEEKFPLHCAKCGSHDINRASSAEEKHDDTTQNQEQPGDTQAALNTLYRNKIS